jgi:hypothetical protein
MSLALPGLRNIISTMQNALALKTDGQLALDKGVHHALEDFRWMQENISTRPTRIAEVVPLPPVAEGHHNASGLGGWRHLVSRSSPCPPLGFHFHTTSCMAALMARFHLLLDGDG